MEGQEVETESLEGGLKGRKGSKQEREGRNDRAFDCIPNIFQR